MADETVCMTCGRRAADPDATICSDPFHLDAPSRPARDGETLSDEQVTKILSKAKREAYHWGDELNTDRGARLRESLDKVATSHAALRAECTRLRAALGMNVEYRDLTGCEHAIHESCDKCVCPTCRTRAVQTKELGWMPVTAFPARAAAPTPGETTNG